MEYEIGPTTPFESSLPPADVCPNCGGAEFVTEPGLDQDGLPTGLLAIICDACGYELGELAPPPPAPEAEPDLTMESLLPGPDEQPRVRAHGTPRWW